MPRGSKPGGQPGAGRPRGSRNKKTLLRLQLEQEAERMNGRTPLQHFMAIMNNPRAEKKRRDFAAAQLMSFMHPRLAPVVNAPQGKTSEDTAQEIRDALRAMHAATAPPPPAPTPEIKPTPAAASPRAQPKAQDAPPPPAQRGLPIRPKRSAAGD